MFTELIPLAMVIALSPLTIIPAVLVLHSPRPRPTALCYLVGWLLGIAAATAVFIEVSGLIGDLSKPPVWASYLRVVVGAALLGFGLFRWFTRRRSAHTPKWMSRLTEVSPWRALCTAMLLCVVNPKVVFMCAAAGLAIGSAGLGRPGAYLAGLVFVAFAGSTVALPILAYAVSGERLRAPLSRLRDWMERQHAALVAGIVIVIGVMVLYKGIHGL